MAAQPIPRPEDATEVEIDEYGNVTGQVHVKNRDMVKFNVTKYGIDPNTKEQGNVCIVNISKENITWGTLAADTENTIKVGNG